MTKCYFHFKESNKSSYALDAVNKTYLRSAEDTESIEQLCTFFEDSIECDFKVTEWDGSESTASWGSDDVDEISFLTTAAATQSESAGKHNSAKVAFAVAGGLGVIALGIYAMRSGKKTTSDDYLLA